MLRDFGVYEGLSICQETAGPTCCLPKAHSTWVLTKFLTQQWPSQRARDALHRFHQAISTPDWGQDLLIKLMTDLDTASFNGRSGNGVKTWGDFDRLMQSQIRQCKHGRHFPTSQRVAFKPSAKFVSHTLDRGDQGCCRYQRSTDFLEGTRRRGKGVQETHSDDKDTGRI